MSIGIKLNCLAALAALLALGPFAAYSLNISSHAAMEAARDELRLIGHIGDDALEDGYLSHVSAQVLAARDGKALLRVADRQALTLRNSLASFPREISGPVEARQLAEWWRHGVAMLRIDADGRLLGAESGFDGVPDPARDFSNLPDSQNLPDFADLADFPGLANLDWKTVQDMTGENLLDKMTGGAFPPEGDFAVIRMAGAHGQTALLALMRPETSGKTFSVALSSLDEVRRRADLGSSGVIGRLNDKFSEVELSAGGSMVLLGADGSVLAAKGAPPDPALLAGVLGLAPDGPLAGWLWDRSAREGPLE